MQRRTLYSLYCIGLGIVALAVVIAVAVAAIKQDDGDASPVVPTVAPSPSSSVSPEADEVVPVPSQSPSAPVASTTPSTSAQTLPDSATSFLKDFYQSYKKGDAKAMQPFFSDDGDAELKSLRSRLFTGVDTNGVPGGPTLFATNSADQKVDTYAVATVSKTGSGWTVSVNEIRINGAGTRLPQITTTVSLIPSGSSWKIDSYARTGESGKYNALLTP